MSEEVNLEYEAMLTHYPQFVLYIRRENYFHGKARHVTLNQTEREEYLEVLHAMYIFAAQHHPESYAQGFVASICTYYQRTRPEYFAQGVSYYE